MQPLQITAFFSGGASSVDYLSKLDPENWGIKYEIVSAFCDTKGASGIRLMEKLGIPCTVIDYKEWRKGRGIVYSPKEAPEAFSAKLCPKAVDPYNPELIMCSGYDRLMPPSFVKRFWERILNVHPADLSIRNPDGSRKYTGNKDVVAQTMRDGAPTRSTIHFIDYGKDTGRILHISDELKYNPDDDPVEHQNRMKVHCDGPAYREALAMIWPKIMSLRPM